MQTDVFVPTQMTWIDAELHRGGTGRQNVNRHIMATYAWPLRVYFLGTNSRWLGEPDDVVNGFFASRLDQPEFFDNWRASGLRLRRWLMNGLCFHLMELRKARRKMAPGAGGSRDDDDAGNGGGDELVTFGGNPEMAVDRAAAVAFVQQAMTIASEACERERLGEHWRIFLRHNIDGIDFRALAKEFGVDEARAAVMSRTAARKFKGALSEVLARDGVDAAQHDAEIKQLMEAMAA